MTPNVPTSDSGTAMLGMMVGAHVAQEREHDEHDEADREDERELDVFDGRAHGLGAVTEDLHVDALRQRRARAGEGAP